MPGRERVEVRQAVLSDMEAWHKLRRQLWPHSTLTEHQRDQALQLANPDRFHVQLALVQGVAIGFVEVSLRERADGCRTTPVGYLEGWFVEETERKQGVGSQLIAAAEAWAMSRGCREMASDARIENRTSITAHNALGYSSIGAVMRFAKQLTSP